MSVPPRSESIHPPSRSESIHPSRSARVDPSRSESIRPFGPVRPSMAVQSSNRSVGRIYAAGVSEGDCHSSDSLFSHSLRPFCSCCCSAAAIVAVPLFICSFRSSFWLYSLFLLSVPFLFSVLLFFVPAAVVVAIRTGHDRKGRAGWRRCERRRPGSPARCNHVYMM